MRILLVGFGSIGQALVPLLVAHGFAPSDITAMAADRQGFDAARGFGIAHRDLPLAPDNHAAVLAAHLGPGDLLVNVSVGVSSLDLMRWCRAHGVLYVDTGIEPWPGGYAAADASTTNHALRRAALALHAPGAPTAVIAHGANPGLVSHFVKSGLRALAAHRNVPVMPAPDWARLAQALGVRVIQIAERDTQVAREVLPPGAFHCTWSPDGLMSEAWQCAELGWGTHEPRLPPDGRHHAEADAPGIYLAGHAAEVRVKTWAPSCGATDGFLITHHESLSIAAWLTVPGVAPARPAYRPTVYYAYDPASATRASLEAWIAQGYAPPTERRVLRDTLVDGTDELGVLFVFEGGAFWYGSTLTLAEARSLAPRNSATTLQVAAGVLGAVDWALAHPGAGVVEAERMDHEHVLAVARPYLGTMGGVMTRWQPGPDGDLSFGLFRLAANLREVGLEAV